MNANLPTCLQCGRSSEVVPLIQIVYRGSQFWICPEHLPILIHKPAQLAGKLPGLEKLPPPEEHEHG